MKLDVKRLATDLDYWNSVAPEGAQCLIDNSYFVKWKDRVELHSFNGDWHVDTWTLNQYVNDQKANVIMKPARGWNSKGNPPVGTVCECALDFEKSKEDNNWSKIQVLYEDESTVVGRILEGLYKGQFSNGFAVDAYEFRPVKTHKQLMQNELAMDLRIYFPDSIEDTQQVAECLITDGWHKGEPK